MVWDTGLEGDCVGLEGDCVGYRFRSKHNHESSLCIKRAADRPHVVKHGQDRKEDGGGSVHILVLWLPGTCIPQLAGMEWAQSLIVFFRRLFHTDISLFFFCFFLFRFLFLGQLSTEDQIISRPRPSPRPPPLTC